MAEVMVAMVVAMVVATVVGNKLALDKKDTLFYV
jgi:Na+/citrate or Na+/malate symporter